MTNSIKYVLAFSAGAAIGVAASWGYLKTKYEQWAQKEIDDVRSYYKNKREENNPVEPEKEKTRYEDIANEYSTESTSAKIEDDNAPYVITPEEFGDVDDYDTTTLYYYTDGILTDLEDNVVENVAGTVGEDFVSHFGEYEDESVCIRNDALKCDYEILKDPRRYTDVKKPLRPHEAEE